MENVWDGSLPGDESWPRHLSFTLPVNRLHWFPMSRLGFITRVLGDSNEKELKRLSKFVEEIEALSDDMAALSDEELAGLAEEFRDRLNQDETLDELLPEAFAAAREMAFRRVGERPYEVQMIGGIVLHEGKIAEMRTGEGKTLTAVAPRLP